MAENQINSMKNEINVIRSEFRVCLQALQKNWLLVVLCTVLGLLLGSLIAIVPEPDIYQATRSISKTASSPSSLSVSDFEDLILSDSVMDEILQSLDGRVSSSSELASILSAVSNESGNILYISARHEDPSFAIEVVNIATDVMVRQINEIYYNAGIVVLEEATSARLVSSWTGVVWLYRLLGAVLGAVLSVAVLMIKTMTSKKALSVNACTLDGEYNLIGVIPYVEP